MRLIIDKATAHMKAQREFDLFFCELSPAVCKEKKLLCRHAALLYPSPRALELFDPGAGEDSKN